MHLKTTWFVLNSTKIISSMSRKGNSYDNAYIEYFHNIIKEELIYLGKFKTREEAKRTSMSI